MYILYRKGVGNIVCLQRDAVHSVLVIDKDQAVVWRHEIKLLQGNNNMVLGLSIRNLIGEYVHSTASQHEKRLPVELSPRFWLEDPLHNRPELAGRNRAAQFIMRYARRYAIYHEHFVVFLVFEIGQTLYNQVERPETTSSRKIYKSLRGLGTNEIRQVLLMFYRIVGGRGDYSALLPGIGSFRHLACDRA